MPSDIQTPSIARQDRLTGKLVTEVIRQVVLRDSAAQGVSAAEEQLVTDSVRQHVFKGNPLTQTDIDAIISRVLRSRSKKTPATQPVEPNPHDAALDPRACAMSLKSSVGRSVTPSLAKSSQIGETAHHPVHQRRHGTSVSQPDEDRRSICDSEASVAFSAVSRASRLSVVRDRDRRAVEALSKLCEVATQAAPVAAAHHATPLRRQPPKAIDEEAEAKAALAAVRKKAADEQDALRRALQDQIETKRTLQKKQQEEERRERDLRVAAAEQSLKEDAARALQNRMQRVLERRQNMNELAQSAARNRAVKQEVVAAERDATLGDAVDHEANLKQERAARRAAVEALRKELLTEAEKKRGEKKKKEIEQLEYEIEILEQMNDKVEQERQRLERVRAERIAAAHETQEVCRKMAAEAKRRENALRISQDQLTIAGDNSYIEKEKIDAERRRKQGRATQDFLARQIRERQLRDVLSRGDDDPYVNKVRIDEIESRQQELEELQVKREAQNQWRAFLDLQHKAKMAVKSVIDVPVSITRPTTNTPWV